MQPSPSISPAYWASLALPTDTDLSAELADLLRRLRIPAAVRYSRLSGPGTLAFVPADAESAVLAMTDGYGPEVAWLRVETAVLSDALDELAGPGSLLDDAPLVAPEVSPAVLPETGAENEADAMSGTTPPAPEPTGIAMAWTTREHPDTIAVLGERFGMVFESTEAGSLGLALRPADRGRVTEATDGGIWAMTDGVAVWQAGDEAAAAFVRRGTASYAIWDAPWILVDPSWPGQTADGASMAGRLQEVTERDHDPARWIKRFGLDAPRATRLRALFRRGPHPRVLDELMSILELPDGWLHLLSETPEQREHLTRIEPRSARQLISTGMREALTAAEPDETRFRVRRPQLWLAISVCGIVTMAVLGATGLQEGRWTAWAPLVGSAIWTLSLIIEGAIPRAFGRVPAASSREPDAADDSDPAA